MIHTMHYSPSESPMANAAVGLFVCREAEIEIKDFCSMGVFDNGELIAGVLYHNYYPCSGIVELSTASVSKKWLTKKVINDTFFMPFEILGCQMLVLRVSERNKVMVSIAKRLGFTGHYIPRLRGRDEGEFIFTLTDDEWRKSSINTGIMHNG